MSDILNAAKAHYSTKLNAPKRIVSVPEWGTEDRPLRIFVKPATLHIRDKIYKAIMREDGQGLEHLVDIIILRALNGDDIPLFTQGDKAEFMNKVDPEVIARVATEISSDEIASANEQMAAIEKN